MDSWDSNVEVNVSGGKSSAPIHSLYGGGPNIYDGIESLCRELELCLYDVLFQIFKNINFHYY